VLETNSKFLEATDKAIQLYDEGFVFSALYGSQNYGLATPTSDVDVKVAFLPSAQDVLLAPQRQAKTLTKEGSTDNTILAKDLRDVFLEFYKQNLNFLEVLATPWFHTSLEFKPVFEELRAHSNEVARYYERGFYLCTCGLFNKLNTDFQKNRFDYKKLVFGLYLRDFMLKYANDVEFKDCFLSPPAEFYRKLKAEKERRASVEQCMEMWNEAKLMMDGYFEKANKMSTTKNDATRKWMDELLYDYVWKYVLWERK
jgi:predicted nucleotidyltransferase